MKANYELIIAEKPSQALKIADALADDKVVKRVINKVPYYEIEHDGKKIVVACTVGHLYNLTEKNKQGWIYPVFDLEWVESYKINKQAKFTKPYLEVIKKLSIGNPEIILGTDYDIEGSTLGWNIIKYICNENDGKRMKFSTLTKGELIDSYKNASQHLDFPQIEAGLTRHYLDALYGFNFSRALTIAIKANGMFKIMSMGRVQGPTLKLIVDKEKEISKFIPTQYWEIEADLVDKNKKFIALHKKGKIEDKNKAEEIFERVKEEKAKVTSVSRSQFKQLQPTPFDLTTLQIEAYRNFKFQPSKTLDIAQSLYLAALISYPRTSSQQLPSNIDYKRLLAAIGKQEQYKALCNELLIGKLTPHNGKKKDPAHPCFTEEAELALNPHGSLKFKDIANGLKWNYDRDINSFYSLPKDEVKVLAFDGKNIVSSHITRIWKTPYNKKMLVIKCSNGAIVKTTPNHRLYTLTKNGFEYVEARDLLENTYVASLPQSIESNNKNNRIIITEEDFIKTYNKKQKNRIYKYFKNKRSFRVKPSEVNTIESLRKLRILPLKYGTKETEFFAKLIGFIFGDGHINYYARKDRERYPSSTFVAEKIDLENIKYRLLAIGIKVDAKVRKHKFTNKVQVLNINNSIFNRLLIALGAPLGDKIVRDYTIPSWILKGDKITKRAFISTYFGNECSKPRVHYRNKRDLKSLYIQIDKVVDLKQSAFNLYSQIKHILENDFSIATSEIKQKNRKKPRKKDNKLTCSTVLSIKNNRDNLLNFFLNVGFSFCDYKERLAKKAMAYLIYRNLIIQDRVIKKELAIKLRKNNRTYSYIANVIDVPEPTIKGWMNYYKSYKELHTSLELPEFNNFNLSIGNESWVKIDKISVVDGPKYVYDVEIDKYHTFFVNGFLVHNCIHPTGEIPEKLSEDENKLYDLVIRRTLSTFAPEAIRENMKVDIDINKEPFIAKGVSTIEPGWHKFYGRYTAFKEEILPDLKEGQEVKVLDIKLLDKETQPSKRYTQASIIKELEKKSLGTKATRSQILDTLYQRNYIKENTIMATELGMSIVETLEKYSPEILDEKLTRHFEKEMDMIMKKKKKGKDVLEEAKKVLTAVLNNFKKHEKEIGQGLLHATIETRNKDTIVGVCKECSGNLKITYSKKNKSYFIACSNYPDCKSTFSIPKYAKPVPKNKTCEECGYPVINMIRAGKRPYDFCINKNCKKKQEWLEKNAGNNNI